ncbi:SMI1/KNR4 family protein [Nocardia sp. KC 131]|uniref:SMI1/KNR4 family protein n=1 Tax=Nocardia arseniciresistens TaxID=3392119 RepID=UPI00398EDB68
MSPTPTFPNDTSLREAERFRQALLDTGFATADEIAGCTDEEISRVAAVATFPLPDECLAFLKVLGRKAGTFFQGKGMFFPEPLDTYEAAEGIAAEPGEDLTVEDRFFFGHHQGYQVFFFEKGRPEVFVYVEGHPGEIQKLGESFFGWLWLVCERSQLLREDTERRRAENEAVRQQMRAEGKL